jgi:UDP-glucuronate 4-epimerase
MSAILVTGAAGFIGFHVAQHLLAQGELVVGFDNLNDYYEVSLKEDRLAQLRQHENFSFYQDDIVNLTSLLEVCKDHEVDRIVHLAAQAGVRYSIENPHAYIESNVTGFMNILECARQRKVEHLVYASSSSVYGANSKTPFSTSDTVDHPVSMYAATKKSNELMAHAYSHLHGLPTTGLRFFTVYGPWGRPDMSPILFADAITQQKPLKVFNYGNHYRDFTYIDDIVDGILRVLKRAPQKTVLSVNNSTPRPPYKVYNIGAQKPVHLLSFIEFVEQGLEKTTKKEMLPMQPGDVERTFADVQDLINDTGYQPKTDVKEGVSKFIAWYRSYYQR